MTDTHFHIWTLQDVDQGGNSVATMMPLPEHYNHRTQGQRAKEKLVAQGHQRVLVQVRRCDGNCARMRDAYGMIGKRLTYEGLTA